MITLYSKQQITDVKRFCGTGRTFLGVGKTYNLGDVHAMPTVFKDLSVKRKDSGEYPITFGPTCVIAATDTGKIVRGWTNNNCESANHILKARTEWKKQDIPKFIEEIYGIVGEQLERCRSIRGMGDYTLDERFVYHYVDLDKWSTLSEESKEKRERRFFNDKRKSSQNIVISTDGQRTVYTTPNTGRKLNQASRKRAERSRSRTPSAKRKLVACYFFHAHTVSYSCFIIIYNNIIQN